MFRSPLFGSTANLQCNLLNAPPMVQLTVRTRNSLKIESYLLVPTVAYLEDIGLCSFGLICLIVFRLFRCITTW